MWVVESVKVVVVGQILPPGSLMVLLADQQVVVVPQSVVLGDLTSDYFDLRTAPMLKLGFQLLNHLEVIVQTRLVRVDLQICLDLQLLLLSTWTWKLRVGTLMEYGLRLLQRWVSSSSLSIYWTSEQWCRNPIAPMAS